MYFSDQNQDFREKRNRVSDLNDFNEVEMTFGTGGDTSISDLTMRDLGNIVVKNRPSAVCL